MGSMVAPNRFLILRAALAMHLTLPWRFVMKVTNLSASDRLILRKTIASL
jgi:hypothetical protein